MNYSFDFQFESHPNLWLSTEVTTIEALSCLKTGLLRNHVVTRVKVFSINGDGESETFIYDIAAAKSGNQPWSLISEKPV